MEKICDGTVVDKAEPFEVCLLHPGETHRMTEQNVLFLSDSASVKVKSSYIMLSNSKRKILLKYFFNFSYLRGT
jgi:hypothetical protein